MRITLFNDGTCEFRKGTDITHHTYVLNRKADRVLYVIDVDGGVDEYPKPVEPVAVTVEVAEPILTDAERIEAEGGGSSAGE